MLSSSNNGQLVQWNSSSIRCAVCNQQAFGMNYGVISCNACKMFFRRVVMMSPGYKCKEDNQCYRGVESSRTRPRCRACRFARCLEVGMRYWSVEEESGSGGSTQPSPAASAARFQTTMDNLCVTMRKLMHLDSTRAYQFETMRTDQDPTIDDLIGRNTRALEARRPNHCMTPQVLSEWSFLGIWTSVEFHNNLDFMVQLEPSDKKILLKNFAIKSYLLSSAFRCFSHNSERLINPDGTELFPECVYQMPQFSKDYVNRIQKYLVGRLAKLGVTSEEYILATVILFCNPALSGLSTFAQKIVSDQQQFHGKTLFDYCMMTWNSQGPVRYQEIVSLGNVLEKCFEDVQHLVQMLQLFHPNSYNYKKLFMESLGK